MTSRLCVCLIIALAVAGCGFTSTSPGEAVVFDRFGNVDEKCYPSGFYAYNPFTTSVHHVDLKVQKYEVKMTAGSHDLQNVHMTVVLNFTIDGQECFKLVQKVGDDFGPRVIQPETFEVSKASTALFKAENVIQERPKLKQLIEDSLRARLKKYWITVMNVSITNIDFDPAYAHAVEQKQVEEQNVQKEEFIRQQKEKRGQQILAEAEGQAKANAILQASLKSSPEVLQKMALEKWDGKLPIYWTGGVVPFVNVGPQGPGK